MDLSQFVDRVCEQAPFANRSRAMIAVEATLAALGSLLSPSERRRLKDELGPSLGRLLEPQDRDDAAAGDLLRAASRRVVPANLDDFYKLVARREWLSLGIAMEHAQVVCQELAPMLSPHAVATFGRRVGGLADLFEPVSVAEPPVAADRVRYARARARANLAEGSPGSRHPLSEARPTAGQTHSIASSSDPHADTKLSSTRGLTQEREGETLASGKPGSRRPLAG